MGNDGSIEEATQHYRKLENCAEVEREQEAIAAFEAMAEWAEVHTSRFWRMKKMLTTSHQLELVDDENVSKKARVARNVLHVRGEDSVKFDANEDVAER